MFEFFNVVSANMERRALMQHPSPGEASDPDRVADEIRSLASGGKLTLKTRMNEADLVVTFAGICILMASSSRASHRLSETIKNNK